MKNTLNNKNLLKHTPQKLVVAISPRALFDLALSHELFMSQGVDAYHDYQTANDKQQLRIAFDGDDILFSDEAEPVFQENGLEAFTKNEVDYAKTLLFGGQYNKNC